MASLTPESEGDGVGEVEREGDLKSWRICAGIIAFRHVELSSKSGFITFDRTERLQNASLQRFKPDEKGKYAKNCFSVKTPPREIDASAGPGNSPFPDIELMATKFCKHLPLDVFCMFASLGSDKQADMFLDLDYFPSDKVGAVFLPELRDFPSPPLHRHVARHPKTGMTNIPPMARPYHCCWSLPNSSPFPIGGLPK